MKFVIKRLSLLAAVLMISAVPVLAEEGGMNILSEPGMQGQKNECLLVAMQCADQVDTIQQRIDRIRGEISRGTAVYTNDELRRLDRQLDDAIKNMNELNAGG